jgi:eukaryotic-like serine/threonine-protein kinase
VRRFAEVVKAAAGLSHPNIVAIHDASTDVAHPFVVSELMTQGSVRRILSDAEEIPVNLVVKYLLQVLHALKAAHAAGVVHRGLKPENLLIDAYGNVKVSDFGFGRVVERDQAVIKQVYVGMGTVGYMAPELFSEPGSAGPQADIYALGIIFYELLTRKLPGRRSPMPSQVNATLPKGIDDIFDKMTRDEREDRYETVAEILADFYRIEGISGFVELGDDPFAKLKFRQPPAPPPVPDPPRLPSPSQPPPVVGGLGDITAGAVAATPTDPTGQAPVVGGDSGGAVGRRPYSYQQRMKNKGET